MKKINWINGKTPIPEDLYKIETENIFNLLSWKVTGMITDLYKLGFIEKNQPINADFLNKYHFELYIPIYKRIKNNNFLLKLLGKFIFRKK